MSSIANALQPLRGWSEEGWAAFCGGHVEPGTGAVGVLLLLDRMESEVALGGDGALRRTTLFHGRLATERGTGAVAAVVRFGRSPGAADGAGSRLGELHGIDAVDADPLGGDGSGPAIFVFADLDEAACAAFEESFLRARAVGNSAVLLGIDARSPERSSPGVRMLEVVGLKIALGIDLADNS